MLIAGLYPLSTLDQTSTLRLKHRRHDLGKDFQMPLIQGLNPLT
jgi:hypothetical protein